MLDVPSCARSGAGICGPTMRAPPRNLLAVACEVAGSLTLALWAGWHRGGMVVNHPERGLLAGLLALVICASCAVAMAAHASSPTPTSTATTAGAGPRSGDRDGDRRLAVAGREERHR